MDASTEKQNIHDEQSSKRQNRKRVRVRLIPIWLRLLIIPGLLVLSLIVGAMIGYGVLGDGKALDVLKKSTWQHIVDIVVSD